MAKRSFLPILSGSWSGISISFLVLLTFPLLSPAQPGQIPFRARFWQGDGVITQPLSGRIQGQGSFITDSNGEISLMVTESSQVQVLLSSSEWTIIYPQNGLVPIPRDEYAFAQIIVARRGQAGGSAALIRKIEQLQSSVAAGDASVQSEISQLKDSLALYFDQKTMAAVEQQLAVYEKIRLENERADSLQRAQNALLTRQGRLEAMGLLTSSLDHYITRAEDLRDIFEFSGYKALNNGFVVEELSAKIQAYNEAYEELNKSKNKILDLAEVYWADNYEVRSRIRALLEYTLDDVHKMTTLSANNLINDISDYRDPRVKKRDKRAKREITSDIDEFTYNLRNKLSTLISRKSEVYQLLEK